MRVANRSAHEAIANRREFTGSNFRGSRMLDSMGILPNADREVLWHDAGRGLFDYIVYSYATPIAWHTSDRGWVVPDVKYSVSTTRHQSIVRKAVSEL